MRIFEGEVELIVCLSAPLLAGSLWSSSDTAANDMALPSSELRLDALAFAFSG
jgi:hypothetical protein